MTCRQQLRAGHRREGRRLGRQRPSGKSPHLEAGRPAGSPREVDARIGSIIKNRIYNFVIPPNRPVVHHRHPERPGADGQLPPRRERHALRCAHPGGQRRCGGPASRRCSTTHDAVRVFKTGMIQTSLGLDFLMSQNLPAHTVGASAALRWSTARTRASSTPAQPTTPRRDDLAGDGRLDRFGGNPPEGRRRRHHAGRRTPVNPETKVDNGSLMQFVDRRRGLGRRRQCHRGDLRRSSPAARSRTSPRARPTTPRSPSFRLWPTRPTGRTRCGTA